MKFYRDNIHNLMNAGNIALACVIALVAFMICTAPLFAEDQNSGYKFGADDIITVTLVGHPEFSGDLIVPFEGDVTFPGAGSLKVSGKTLAELETELKARFTDRGLRDPEVYVTVKGPRPLQVNVLGSVNRPGAFPLKSGWRITEALSAAGGIILGILPADCTVIILRGSNKITVPLVEALRGSETGNLLIQVDDTITVEPVEQIPIYVMGKVRGPGLYNVRKEDATVLSAITIAGGPLEEAALSKVTVTHLTGDTETINIIPITIEGKQENITKLRSGDLVVVPESVAKYAVLGIVNNPGVFPLKENQVVRLSDAIGMANGGNKSSGMSKVALMRLKNGKQERLMFNFTKFAKNGDLTQNPEIQSGDIIFVPETKKMDFNTILSTISNSIQTFWMLNRL